MCDEGLKCFKNVNNQGIFISPAQKLEINNNKNKTNNRESLELTNGVNNTSILANIFTIVHS